MSVMSVTPRELRFTSEVPRGNRLGMCPHVTTAHGFPQGTSSAPSRSQLFIKIWLQMQELQKALTILPRDGIIWYPLKLGS